MNKDNRTHSSEDNDTLTSKILLYVDKNLMKDITLSELSERFGVSVSYLSRRFFNRVQIPVMQYIRRERMVEAKRLIKGGKAPQEVAKMMGFSHYSTFYRSYISVIGNSPSRDK